MFRAVGTLGIVWIGIVLAGCGLTDRLAADFHNPPASARPHTWWHWMNGNVTREGITADLEAMKQIGLGGAQIFNVSESIPAGPIDYMSPEWRALVKHAVSEADRLGLELCMHNCAGWSSSGGPWITPEFAMQMVTTSETRASGPARFSEMLPMPPTKKDYYKDIAVLAFPTPRDESTRIKNIKLKAGFDSAYDQQPDFAALPADATIRRESIVDLTKQLQADGRLNWDVPAGQWTILRIGHTPTGAVNAPSPESGRGLECDKLSRAGMDHHWAGVMGPVIRDLGPLAGRTLNNSLIDSYEVGHQNWTPRFREEFLTRRGYDPLLYLPALTGRVVDGGEASERFLWDLRRTIADLFADNYYSYFAQLCHHNDMQASIEPYDGPFECMLAGRDADIPMGEFWVGGGESNSCKLASSVAHTYGRKIIGAEAFTAEPNRGRWQNHPYSLKAVGDLMYCSGINRYIIHRYAHQPWVAATTNPSGALQAPLPGMTMGQWGTHFERTNTWWNHGGPEWVQYLTRCQAILQQGLFVADVCYFSGEAAPSGAPYKPELKAKGYDYDACDSDVLSNRAYVKNGRIVLADGMSYRVLVLPDTPFMTPEFARRLQSLIEQGATVIGPKPTASPSLSGQPASDAAVREIAQAVWGDCDGKSVKEHAFGKGRVIWGKALEDVLIEMNVRPDCEFISVGGKPKMAWIHRVADGADIYFVSNQKPYAVDVDCTFRVSGKTPEFWHADTGWTEAVPLWSQNDGRTTVPIHFDPAGSLFVVFATNAGAAEQFTSVKREGVTGTAPAAPRIEIQKAVYEAVDGTGGTDVTAKVAALVNAGESTIPANNANFGDPTYMHVKRLRVELTRDGKPETRTIEENGTLDLVQFAGPTGLPPYLLADDGNSSVTVWAFEPGKFAFQTSKNRTVTVEIPTVPQPVEVSGPWTVRFPPDRGAPASIKMDKLIPWNEHADPGVRYFSGTAEYETEFAIPKGMGRVFLDLGQVSCIAEVTFNGVNIATLWKPPYAIDLTFAAKNSGKKNVLRVRVTNLWVNRLIGDEQYADDCEWEGIHLKRWPQWFLDRTPRPSRERLTFTTWKHYKRESPLVDSGLIGPVMLRSAVSASVK
jgi:hypothetical protein